MLNPVLLTPSAAPDILLSRQIPINTEEAAFFRSPQSTAPPAVINGGWKTPPKLLINGGHSQQWDLGQLPLYPAWQTLWHKFTRQPHPLRRPELASFDLSSCSPRLTRVLEAPNLGIDNNSELTFIQGQTYYFMVDALVPGSHV